jgi:Ribbon-helix-helix protein, copG family
MAMTSASEFGVFGGRDAIALPEAPPKIMQRSQQRGGVVAGGTLLCSGARLVTVSFPPDMARKLNLAAAKNGVSASEMVRQCVDNALR